MTRIDLNKTTDNLVLIDNIWYSKSKSMISYPDDGNKIFSQIEENSFWFQHRNNCILEVVKNFLPNGIFYDIGGGNGFVAKTLENIGIDTVLIEPGKNGAINAKKRGLKNIICSTFENIGFHSKTLHAIGLFDVLEHIKNDERFLKLIYGYLKQNGKLYITVPSFNFLWSNEDNKAGHFKRYTTKGLIKMLNKIGFNVEYATYFFSILPIPIFFIRSLIAKLTFSKHLDDIEKYKNQHFNSTSDIGKFLNNIWKIELNRIKNKNPYILEAVV